MSALLLLLLFVLAWVVLILPKQRELKRHNALVAALEVGDEVMSGSGIYGTITAIEGDIVYLEIAPDIEIKVARRAVAAKVEGDGTADEAELDAEVDEELDSDVPVLEAGDPTRSSDLDEVADPERTEADWPDRPDGRP
jgi:preprotein translocase subunit YajC